MSKYQYNTLEAYYTKERRINYAQSSRHEYNVKDHLGNTRVCFTPNPANPTNIQPKILQQTNYYAYGLPIGYLSRTYPLSGTASLEQKYQNNQKELNSDFGLLWNDYGARWLDLQRGVWGQIDPLAEKYYAWSGYNYVMGNPILMVDPDGRVIVDSNGNPVDITIDEKTGALNYSFNKDYSEKKLEKVKAKFMQSTDPVLKAMAASEDGRADIKSLSDIATLVDIVAHEGSNENANSIIDKGDGSVDANGFYPEVHIDFYLGNYDASKGDLNEWVGSTMTVETGHINDPAQIAIEKEAESVNDDYRNQPNSPQFQQVYTPLLNKATMYRIKYREATGQPLNQGVFAPLDNFNIPYNNANKEKRKTYDGEEK